MPKFPEDFFVVPILEDILEKHALHHLRVRKRGDLVTLESGPKNDSVRHLRLRRATRQWYTAEIASHTGRWDPVFPLRASPNVVLETILRDFPWVLMPIA